MAGRGREEGKNVKCVWQRSVKRYRKVPLEFHCGTRIQTETPSHFFSPPPDDAGALRTAIRIFVSVPLAHVEYGFTVASPSQIMPIQPCKRVYQMIGSLPSPAVATRNEIFSSFYSR